MSKTVDTCISDIEAALYKMQEKLAMTNYKYPAESMYNLAEAKRYLKDVRSAVINLDIAFAAFEREKSAELAESQKERAEIGQLFDSGWDEPPKPKSPSRFGKWFGKK